MHVTSRAGIFLKDHAYRRYHPEFNPNELDLGKG
jgi:hypothetical protein